MYFDFEDGRPDTPSIEGAISRREGVLLSFVVHLAAIALAIFAPQLPLLQEWAVARAARQAELARQLELAREREATRFVFVQPRLDIEALRPPIRGEASDKDRQAQAPERAQPLMNPLPFARGNSAERVEAERMERTRGDGERAVPPAGEEHARAAQRQTNGSEKLAADREGRPVLQPPPVARGRSAARAPTTAGSLGDALRNLQRYVDQQTFNNPGGGGGEFGPSIQFDTKGVEFGPWIRRFVAQIKRNWFVPYAAMSLKGHVVITFYVHKDGTISELTVVDPSSVEAFHHAAYNALLGSNPTQPLPPEYPSDRAFFTVTFYYNESPPTP